MHPWHAPTDKQITWAAELGVEVPAGISRENLGGVLRRVHKQQIRAQLKELDLKPDMRLRRIVDGVTYTIRKVDGVELRLFNEKAKMHVNISVSSILKFYEVLE